MGRIAEKLLGPGLAGLMTRTTSARVDGLLEYEVPAWYTETFGGMYGPNGGHRTAENVWVANRCQQMNAQQIASMPLKFHGPDGAEPLWVSAPDEEYFPNGIGDAIHYIVEQIYGWGYAIIYVTDFYATGYPRTWTVLPSCEVEPCLEGGQKVYKLSGGGYLQPDHVVQIDRNPGRAHGTSALRAYGTIATGLLAAERQAAVVNSGGYPAVYLQPKRPLDANQARELQAQWMQRTAERGGGPPVVPPDITVAELNINPADLQLLESRAFDARAICTAYGVPSVLMNLALQGGMTYQNPAALGEFWWRFELRPTATRIDNAFSAQMLPRGQFVSFAAEDTFAPLTAASPADDEQAAQGTADDSTLTAPPGAVPNPAAPLAAVN